MVLDVNRRRSQQYSQSDFQRAYIMFRYHNRNNRRNVSKQINGRVNNSVWELKQVITDSTVSTQWVEWSYNRFNSF